MVQKTGWPNSLNKKNKKKKKEKSPKLTFLSCTKFGEFNCFHAALNVTRSQSAGVEDSFHIILEPSAVMKQKDTKANY